MEYQMLVLDLDGTLTNSKKEITEPTRKALIEIQQRGKRVVLASGRPINGVLPLAKQLELHKYGSYILSFNGARITRCSTEEVIYNKTLPSEVIRPIHEMVSSYPGLDIITYEENNIISGIAPNQYTNIEVGINKMNVIIPENFSDYVRFPVNKLLIPGDPPVVEQVMAALKKRFHSYLNIYRSEPYFLEIMPQNIDKAYSLQRLANSIGLSADDMICCGDGYNDVSMIEFAGLGVAMANAQSVVKESADYITLSNDEDGILHVIDQFMR